MHIYNIEWPLQANADLTRSNSEVMEKIGTYDCDNERHAGVTQDFVIDDNKSDKDQEEVLLLKLREQL